MKLNINKGRASTVHFSLKKCALLLLFFSVAPSLWAQFSVSATTTPQTCTGNGALQLSVQNQDPGTTINYKVYFGTDATGTLVHDSTNPVVNGQADGNYYVIATQSIGNTPISSANTTVAIADQTSPVIFTITRTPVHCGNDATVTVTATAGTPVSYKLTSLATGTVIGPQASNVFTGLAAGQYTIFILDSCGDGNSQVVTVISEYHQLEITAGFFPDVELPGCDLLTIKNQILSTNGINVIYPLQVTFTVYPPTGGSVTYTQTVAGGPSPTTAEASQVIPYYYGQPNHTYKITVTDICGNTIESPIYIIDPLLSVSGTINSISCSGKTIEYKAFKYVGPFTLEFVQSPTGFNPQDYNAQYPGPYTATDTPILFGAEGNPLPYGNYQVKIYDACNRAVDPVSPVIEVPEPDIEVMTNPFNATCVTNGGVEAYIPGLFVGEATITAYAGSGTYTTPQDISDYILPTKVSVVAGGMPPGTYTIVLKDTCGIEYPPVDFIVLPYNGDKASANSRPDCEEGFGTVQINGKYGHIEIIMAPAAYPFTLPHDVTAYFNEDINTFSMDHLPPGQYKFKASNNCDDDIEINAPTRIVPIFAYNETVNDYNFTPHCGSFDLFINHQSTGVAFIKFGLQKLDETTGLWTHPGTGVIYNEGDELITDLSADPTEINALLIQNNFNSLDLVYPSGKYRVIKQYITYADGSLQGPTSTKMCTKILYEFEYYKDIVIDGAVSLACMGNSGDVMIIAHGVPPLNYRVVKKNGDPFLVDNGTNSVFSGLESAVYVVEVSDSCSQRTLTFNIAEIPSLVYVPDPSELDSITLCDVGSDTTEAFDISSYTAIILDDQDPDKVTITFHMSQSDAQQGINAIPDLTNVNTTSRTIYARATHSANPDCIALTNFDLIVRPLPPLNMKDTWGGCDGNNVTVTADYGYAYYNWTRPDGTNFVIQSNEITVSDPGTYSVGITDDFGCVNTKDFEVVLSPIPVISSIQVDDWTDHSNVLTVVMAPTTLPGNYEYSLDNIHFQDSPVFIGLDPGQYTVYVKDKFDCGSDSLPTYILTYPKFFTPNNDGTNDYWKIKFSILEPNMLVYIFDRYGKLITGFGATSKGWDGTFDGAKLPATDYWFVVKRQNGEELKGHFSMIR